MCLISGNNFISAQRPISVFCGPIDTSVPTYAHTWKSTYAQLAPMETLGTQFYIPPLSGFDLTNAQIKVIASEDSTVDIIEGDYHNLDTLSWTGNILTREIVEQTVSANLKLVIFIAPVHNL